jgi:ubiquinone/menaquinone biosynthesis C-methylase UbiE
MRTLSHDEAKAFYNWVGAKQDSQRFYEDAAIDDLISHAAFNEAHSVFEFGCGTGRLARRLLSDFLRADCRYLAVDISETMVRLARERLARWGARACIEQTSGDIHVALRKGSFDRLVTCYVLDLLSEADIRMFFAEGRRALEPNGLLCTVSMTRGASLPAKVVSTMWETLFRMSPKLVGGCRPLSVRDFLDESLWSLRYHNVVTRFGISSEIMFATRTAARS